MFLLRRPRPLATLTVPLALAGLALANPDWTARAGLDFWNAPASESQLRAAERESERLERLSEHCRQQHEVRRLVILDLLDGRTTLADTARRMDELNRQDPDFLRAVRHTFPEATDDEEAATLQTLATVRALLANDPERFEEAAARLRAEQEATWERAQAADQ